MSDWPRPPAPARRHRRREWRALAAVLGLTVLTTVVLLYGIFGDLP